VSQKRTVLITGGSSGIGTAMVHKFAAAGYRVWFTYHTGEDRADTLVSALAGTEVQSFPLELGNRRSHADLTAALPGPVDVLVNNAGLGSRTVEKISLDVKEQDAALMMVNAVGTLWLTRDLLPAMIERGFGKIILVSSVGGGVSAFPGFHPADGMSKAALAYLGQHLQMEHNAGPIDVFVICPGATETPMLEASALSKLADADRAAFIRSLPGGRLIDPAEIAELAVWLCTEPARVLRGAVLDSSLGLGAHPGAWRRPGA
jgi:NAD(P)-dependent dehydrogenase (short-subunit alcohol dehydrogenase family)